MVGNVFFNGQLGGLHNEIHSTIDSDSKVEREEVAGEARPKAPSDMVGDDSSHSCGDANWTELCRVLLILVETEKVSISKVLLHAIIHLAVVETLKYQPYCLIELRVVAFHEPNEYVQRVHKEPIRLALVLLADGGDDVALELCQT